MFSYATRKHTDTVEIVTAQRKTMKVTCYKYQCILFVDTNPVSLLKLGEGWSWPSFYWFLVMGICCKWMHQHSVPKLDCGALKFARKHKPFTHHSVFSVRVYIFIYKDIWSKLLDLCKCHLAIISDPNKYYISSVCPLWMYKNRKENLHVSAPATAKWLQMDVSDISGRI